jgi:hypothetical protein
MKKTTKSPSSALVLSAPSASALAAYDGLFDSTLTEAAEGETGIAPFISTTDGVMKHGEIEIGKELDVIILGVAVEHALYPQAYSKGKPSNPVCFFVGRNEKDAAPDSSSPQKQGTSCAQCVKGAFGSAPNGRAKACRQTRRLLLLPTASPLDPDGQLYRLRVPPTSVKHLRAYVAKVRAYRPVETVVTRVEFVGHDKNRFEVKFTAVDKLDDRALLQALARRAAEAKDTLFALPTVGTADEAKPVQGGRRIVKR